MVVGALWLCLWQSKIRMIGAGVATLGLVLAVTTPQPLLLAGNNARVFAIQDSLAITVLGPGANANRFVRNIWAERAGFSKDQKLGKSKTPLKQSIQCDTLGCLYHKNGLTIALVWQEAALSEDCWIADVIISRVPVRKYCPKPHQIIDRYDLWKNGAHALYLDGKKVTIINTTDVRGVRPWTITPKPRGNNSPSSGLSS
jgi:competence protein ComEC